MRTRRTARRAIPVPGGRQCDIAAGNIAPVQAALEVALRELATGLSDDDLNGLANPDS